MKTVDVTIIGAGPGGGMAACQLADLGLNVLLLEKHKLPRLKPCGGAMPASIKSLLNWDFSSLIESEVARTRTMNNYARPIEFEGRAPILFVNRANFDYHLIERAAHHITIRDEYTVESVEETDKAVIIRGTDGDSVQSTYLIAADGAFSPTARALNLNQERHYAPALDAEVEVEPDVFAVESQRATFNYFCLPNGYGWIFPKRDLLACGVGTWGGQRINLRAVLDDFLKRSFPPSSIRSVRVYGYPIPIYTQHLPIATRRVCLVGDAASLVDPILGEGIRHALVSGKVAAQVIANLLGANGESGFSQAEGCKAYEAQIHSTIGKEFVALTKFIVPIYLNAPDYFYSKFVETGFSYTSLSHMLAKSFSFVNL